MLINTSKLSNNEEVRFDKAEISLDANLFKPYFATPTKCFISGYVKKVNYNLEIELQVESEFSGLCYKCGDVAKVLVNLPLSTTLVKNSSEYLQFVTGNELDLTKLVGEEIVLNFPSVITCKQTCKGLCGVCGKNLNFEKCNCDKALDNNSNNPFGELRKLLNKNNNNK